MAFYLIPFETSKIKWDGDGCAPKYLELLGEAQGLIPKETTTDRKNRTWLRNFYVVKMPARIPALEAKPDVVRIRYAAKAKLKAHGIDMAGVKSGRNVKRKITRWLLGHDKFDMDKM